MLCRFKYAIESLPNTFQKRREGKFICLKIWQEARQAAEFQACHVLDRPHFLTTTHTHTALNTLPKHKSCCDKKCSHSESKGKDTHVLFLLMLLLASSWQTHSRNMHRHSARKKCPFCRRALVGTHCNTAVVLTIFYLVLLSNAVSIIWLNNSFSPSIHSLSLLRDAVMFPNRFFSQLVWLQGRWWMGEMKCVLSFKNYDCQQQSYWCAIFNTGSLGFFSSSNGWIDAQLCVFMTIAARRSQVCLSKYSEATKWEKLVTRAKKSAYYLLERNKSFV